MDAETDAAEDLELPGAPKAARANYALGCLRASLQPGLSVAERATYSAWYREAEAEAEAVGEPRRLWEMHHTGGGAERPHKRPCTDSDDPIGSVSIERMYVANPHKAQMTSAESGALEAVVDHLWEQAQRLPPTSRVRAWLLRIRRPLAKYLGVRPLLPAPLLPQQHLEHPPPRLLV
jgi:hypothetical protein